MATPTLRAPYGVSSPYTVDDPGVLKNPFGLGTGGGGGTGPAGPAGHGSTTTMAAPTASGGNWVFTVADTTAFNAAGLPIYCSDSTNSIYGTVVNVISSTQLTVAPTTTTGTVTSIANGSTFTFSGVAGANASAYVGITTNSGNAYTATPSPAITSYVTGTLYTAQFNAANTGATTLNISGLGALNVYKNGAALAGGEIAANASIALTYDGTQLNMTGDGGGGGGLSDWAEATFTASPNNTVGASSLTPVSTLTNADAVISPKGKGAIQARVADGATSGGNKRGSSAVDWQMVRSVVTQVASGKGSVIGGGYSNTASNVYSTVAGGCNNTASGLWSSIHGSKNNTASGLSSSVISGDGNSAAATGCIVGGRSNFAGGSYDIVLGENNNSRYGGTNLIVGRHHISYSSGAQIVAAQYCKVQTSGGGSGIFGGKGHTANGAYSVIVGGVGNSTSGNGSTVTGGFGNIANGAFSLAGGNYSSTRGRRGSTAFSSGKIAATADSQNCTICLNAVTTSATAVQMSALSGGSATAANQLSLPTGACATFTGLIVAKDTAGGATDCSHWSFAGGINNLNGITTLTGAVTPTLIAQTAGASAWAVTITADNTNKTLKVSVSGDAGKTLHWSCFIRDVEVA